MFYHMATPGSIITAEVSKYHSRDRGAGKLAKKWVPAGIDLSEPRGTACVRKIRSEIVRHSVYSFMCHGGA